MIATSQIFMLLFFFLHLFWAWPIQCYYSHLSMICKVFFVPINFPSTWFFSIDMESDTRIEVAQERLSSRRVWIGGEIKNDFNTLSTSHCIFCRGRLFCKVILHKDTIKFVLQWLNSGRFNLGANMDYAGCYTVQF